MFRDLPFILNLAVFAGSAAVVWFAGTRLARYADGIATRTGIGREFLGIMLLGGVTSLPEIAVATTATLQGTPALSVNDVLGSAAINVVILAVADATVGRGALTGMLGSPGLLLQGVIGIVIMAFTVGAVVAGDVTVLGIGAWCWMMLGAYLIGIWMLAQARADQAWKPAPKPWVRGDQASAAPEAALRRLVALTAAAGAAILVAGFLLARTADALAGQTGLGESFFGAVVLGFSTSLPEVSTVIAAVKIRQYAMAVSDIFGTNLFNVTIIVLVDALHDGGPVLVEAGPFAGFAALVALVLTAIYMGGMVERRDRTVMRMGVDSVAVLFLYAAGVAVLYTLR